MISTENNVCNFTSLTNSISLIRNEDKNLEKVEEAIILELTYELRIDIEKINPVLIDMILINQPSISDDE